MQSYGDLCTQFYDLDKPRAPELALEWYVAQLSKIDGRILEPMCGSGRFMAPMVQRGLLLDGVDPSGAMLRACSIRLAHNAIVDSPWRTSDPRSAQDEANAAPVEYPRVALWQQKLETLDLQGRRYAAAFIPAASFCLLHEPAVAREALARLRAHLQPGGLLLIEFEPPHNEPPADVVRTVTDGGRQIRLAGHSEYDPASQLETMRNVYELKQSGKVIQTEHEVLHLRCYTPEQMVAELTAAGFTDVTANHQDFGWVANAAGEP